MKNLSKEDLSRLNNNDEALLRFSSQEFLQDRKLNGKSSVLFTPGKTINSETKLLSTVAVVLIELPLSVHMAVYEYMNLMQVLTQRIRFLIITDTDELRQIRKYGWLVEHIISRSSFEYIEPLKDWEELVQDRIDSILTNLEVAEVLCPNEDGIDRIQHNKICKLTKISIPFNSVAREVE